MKKDVKRTLKISGILFLVLSVMQIFALCMRIYSVHNNITKIQYNWFDYTLSATEIILSLVSGIIYLVLQSKNQEDILKKHKLFFTLTILNILNSFAGWVISFWVQIVIEQSKRLEYSFANPLDNIKEDSNKENQEYDSEGSVIMKEGDYEVLHTETLTSRLEELNKLRSKNLISQEEYVKLRQEAIDKFLN